MTTSAIHPNIQQELDALQALGFVYLDHQGNELNLKSISNAVIVLEKDGKQILSVQNYQSLKLRATTPAGRIITFSFYSLIDFHLWKLIAAFDISTGTYKEVPSDSPQYHA